MMTLKGRYEHGRLKRSLPDERHWIEQVRVNLLARAKEMKPMSRFRIESQVAWYIKPILENEKAEGMVDKEEIDKDAN